MTRAASLMHLASLTTFSTTRRAFAAKVIDTFAESYVAGETPIPCVTCNNEIKFRDLLETAKELGAEVLVTGHYVQRRDTAHGPELARGVDPDRDQSYFLFGITKEQLANLWFPIGGMHKARSARAGALVQPSRRRQVRQSGHLLRADGALHRCHRAAEAERARIRATSSTSTGGSSAATTASFTTRSASGAASKFRPQKPFTSCGSMRREMRSWSARATALTTTGLVLRNVNWLGEKPLVDIAAEVCRFMFACGRRRRCARH